MTGLEQASTRPLPPGVDEAGFARAVDAFTAALGSGKVLTGETTCASSAIRSRTRRGTNTRPRRW